MPSYEEVLTQVRELSRGDRERLARELSAEVERSRLDMLADRPPSPHSVAWLKSERGHAVLATDTGPVAGDLPPGGAAVAGMWRDMAGTAAGGEG